jgi:hypothetical protein
VSVLREHCLRLHAYCIDEALITIIIIIVVVVVVATTNTCTIASTVLAIVGFVSAFTVLVCFHHYCCAHSLKKPKDADKEEEKDVKGSKLLSKLGVGPFWVPLYGAPPAPRALTQVVGEGFNKERDEMNHHPESASAYRYQSCTLCRPMSPECPTLKASAEY